jgi:hypothetical protein
VGAKSFSDAWKRVGANLKQVFAQLLKDLIAYTIRTLALKAILALIPGLGQVGAVAGGIGGGGGAGGGLLGGLGALFGSAQAGRGQGIEVFGRLSGQDILLSGQRTGYINSRLGG